MQRKSEVLNKEKPKRKKKQTVVNPLPKWKRIRGGLHTHSDGQKVKKGEFLYAEEYDIPEAFRNSYELVSMGARGDIKGNGLKVVPSLKRNRYDIMNEAGATLNEVPLTKKEADAFAVEAMDEDE